MDSLAAHAGILLVLCCQSDGFGYSNLDDSISTASSLSPNPAHHLRERLIIAQPSPTSSPGGASFPSHPVAPTLDRTHSDDYRSLKKKGPHSALFDSVQVHDQYAVLSAHDALLSLASELMSVYHDVAATVRLKGREQSIYMHRWHEQRNTFIVVYHTHQQAHLLPLIIQTQHLLHKGHSTTHSFREARKQLVTLSFSLASASYPASVVSTLCVGVVQCSSWLRISRAEACVALYTG